MPCDCPERRMYPLRSSTSRCCCTVAGARLKDGANLAHAGRIALVLHEPLNGLQHTVLALRSVDRPSASRPYALLRLPISQPRPVPRVGHLEPSGSDQKDTGQ